jgi:hypothetical protein
MDNDVFNLEIRRFLKEFGVTAHREVEDAVEAAWQAGKLQGHETIHARARIEIPALGTYFDIERDIPLA